MDKGFEQIARKPRAPYLANPARYHPTRKLGAGKYVVMAIACGAGAIALAHFTEPYVADSFRFHMPELKKTRALPPYYFKALIAYYTVALYAVYLFITAGYSCSKRIGESGEIENMHLGWFSLTIFFYGCAGAVVFATLAIFLLDPPIGGKMGVVYVSLILPPYLMAFYFILGACAVAFCRWMNARND